MSCEEARVLYTYMYRQQMYIYPGQSPVHEHSQCIPSEHQARFKVEPASTSSKTTLIQRLFSWQNFATCRLGTSQISVPSWSCPVYTKHPSKCWFHVGVWWGSSIEHFLSLWVPSLKIVFLIKIAGTIHLSAIWLRDYYDLKIVRKRYWCNI